jgi:tRNA 5-methylaminomethyl-2-thiouridine biosynthesis bifunctional protein
MEDAVDEDDASPILFDADGPPRSRLYGDLYFSRDDGLAEAGVVFLQGCGLPERWSGRTRFTVGELGFGTGLNILALLDLWRATSPPQARLSIFSIEAHPLTPDEAARALGAWPQLAKSAEILLQRWPGRRQGLHRVDLPEWRAILDVAVMDAAVALEMWSGRADAWFLDGFAPSRNPAMWTRAVMAGVAARSAPGAVAATFTVAGEVRRNLTAAGFSIERHPGFGAKRERLAARLPGPTAAIEHRVAPRVAVIGAGVAGASLARAFAAEGVTAEIFDAEGPGAGASGNPAALVMPGLDAGLGGAAQLHAAGFSRAVRLYHGVPDGVIATGALQIEGQGRDRARFAKIAESALFEPDSVAPISAAQASAIFGEPIPGGLEMKDAVVVDPGSVLGAWLGQVRTARITRIEPTGSGWRLIDAEDHCVAEADVVCLAGGASLAVLLPEAPITQVRGQLNWVEGVSAPTAAAWGGYVAAMRGGIVFGATHDRGDEGVDLRAEDDARNLETLAARLPRIASEIRALPIGARASIRAATPDTLPLAGEIAPGLFALGALGGRGFGLAPLLAEHLAALALGTPSPLPAPLARLVDPGRFAERARRREVGRRRERDC